ncbi:two-component regulator propeller domain-containing protein [Chitinophaga sp.]|uniref:type IX secretion system anionic LPS delivery protein PorZ n=1 Tax=uncultured Chitinophaga sp. TaxID=339340 RepID=UPI0026077998|nr:two-component regulator propeller domain-containing protein [uncultured Chitinophaga sp.]
MIFISNTLRSQNIPIGQWREHFPARQAIAVTAGGGEIFCATAYGLFSVSTGEHAITRYGKSTGLHDAGISAMAWHEGTATLVLAYRNGNIDLLSDGRVTNLPEVLQRPGAPDKAARSILITGDKALLPLPFGIIAIDLRRREITDTWTPGFPITSATIFQNDIYAATPQGVFRAPLTAPNLADPSYWNPLPPLPAPAQQLAAGRNLAARVQDTLFRFGNGAWEKWIHDRGTITFLQSNGNILFAGLPGKVLRIDGIAETTFAHNLLASPAGAVETGNSLWLADRRNGLTLHENNTFTSLTPDAPEGTGAGALLAYNGAIWAASGSVSDNGTPSGNALPLSVFREGEWAQTGKAIPDAVALAAGNGNVYAGSFGGGVSTFRDGALTLEEKPLGRENFAGLAADAQGNLWASAYGASQQPLLVKQPGGGWTGLTIPFSLPSNALSQILTDFSDQQWIVSPQGGGVVILHPGANIADSRDDRWKQLLSGAGRGNLPSSQVYCLAQDRDGWIWIGTARGIGVVQCAPDIMAANACEAWLPVVRTDNFAGYLFQNEQVLTIAVDGANRKWAGTRNGAWLVSADGSRILQHFHTGNSPLPHNTVHRIAIDPVTGEVFFATEGGLVSWRGEATEGSETQEAGPLVFPNPIPSGYSGPVAIRGLVRDAYVKITDVTGKLVFQTRAQGGQAIWNGKDYTGFRPQSGIYLVLASDAEGKEKIVTKLVFIR